MRAWLIQIDAWNGAAPVVVRMASHDDDRLCHLNDAVWWPVIAKLPTLRYDFFDGGFDAGSITSPSGSFSANIEAIPTLPALAIHDARIRIWIGTLGDGFEAFTLISDGRVKDQPSVDAGTSQIDFGADDSWLDQPLLATYAGTGAGEGGEDLKGQVKPLALGAPRYAPATLIDPVANIYQLSAYGRIADVEAAFERLNRFGDAGSDVANFAALASSDIVRGQWATCLAQGLVRFGAPPDGMLCFHLGGDVVGGWSQLPGDIIARIATIGGGAGRYAMGDITALNVARPWPQSIMVTAQTTARDLIQRVAMSVNAVAYVDWLGQLRVAPLEIGQPSLTIASDGSALPPVADIQQIGIAAPYWKVAQGAAVTWQVHAFGDIAFNAPLNPRGPFDLAETYREGDMVTLPNGSQWLFVATTPATGSAPSDVNVRWFRLSDAITAANINYEDGTRVEDLKPAGPGATKGAPTGTDVAGRPAEGVIADIDEVNKNLDILTPSIFELAKLTGTLNAIMQAKTTLEGRAIGTVVAEVREVGESAVEDLKLLGARNAGGTAWNLSLDTVMVTDTVSLAQRFRQVEAYTDGGINALASDLLTTIVDGDGASAQRLDTVEAKINGANGLSAKVSFLTSALVTEEGTAEAKAVLSLKVNGRVSGLVAINDGIKSALDFDFDAIRMFTPAGQLMFVAQGGEVFMPNVRAGKLTIGAMDEEFLLGQDWAANEVTQEFPGGLIIKTGRYRAAINDEVQMSIVFADPFPSVCVSFVPTPYISTFSAFRDLWLQCVGEPTRFGASVGTQSSTSNDQRLDGFNWIAFGR